MMSLTYSQIEALLTQGISFGSQQKEYVVRADPANDKVTVSEMTGLARITFPLELIVDRARADEAGSDLADAKALKRLLGELMKE